MRTHKRMNTLTGIWFTLLLIAFAPTFLSADPSHFQAQTSPEPTLTHTSLPTIIPTSTPEHSLIIASRVNELAQLRRWQAHPSAVLGISFSPDLIHLVSTGNDLVDGTAPIRLWNVRTGEPIEFNFTGILPYALASTVHFSHDGQYVATSVGSILVWNIADGSQIARIGQGSIDIAFADVTPSSDGSLIAVAREDGLVSIWSVPQPLPDRQIREEMGLSDDYLAAFRYEALITAFRIDAPLRDIAFDPVTQKIFILSGSGDLTIFTWEGINGRAETVTPQLSQPASEPIQGYPGSQIALRAGTSTVAYTDSANTVVVYDLNQQQPVAHYDLSVPISCIMYSPNGEILVITELTENSAVHILDSNTGKSLMVSNTQSMITNCTFSPDGTQFATGNAEGEITIWGIA